MPSVEQLDLNLLVALDALLTEGSVTRAATRLGITQSGMSHKLRRLRETFEDPLLVAGVNGLVATPRAQGLLAPLRRGLHELRAVVASPRAFDPATATQTFNVMSSDFAEFSILPLVLQRVTTEAPGLTVNILNPDFQAGALLQDGSVDFVVGPQLPTRGGLVQKKIAADELTSLVRRNHPAVKKRLDLRTFVALPHLVTSLGTPRNVVDEALAARGLSRRVAMRIPNFIGGPFIVARSNLIWTTGTALAREAVRLLPVVAHPPPLKLENFGIFMTWHERNGSDAAHRFVRDIAESTTRAVVTEGKVLPWPDEE